MGGLICHAVATVMEIQCGLRQRVTILRTDCCPLVVTMSRKFNVPADERLADEDKESDVSVRKRFRIG